MSTDEGVVVHEPAPGQNPSSDALRRAEEAKRAGNAVLARGDYADACVHYDQGLVSLVAVGGTFAQRASDLRLALHLNAALAHLRMENLASATDHATGALAIDPRNVKALYRRGMASLRLSEKSGREAEGKLGLADLERVLELEPSNVEVRANIKRRRAAARAEELEAIESRREVARNMFAGGKPIYAETDARKPPPVIRNTGCEDRQVLLSACSLGFSYVRGDTILNGVNLELRRGQCLGIFGNNGCGKTTLVRLFAGQLSPTSGCIEHHGKADSSRGASSTTALMAAGALTAVLAAVAASILSQYMLVSPLLLLLALVPCSAAMFFLCKLVLDKRNVENRWHTVVHVGSDASEKDDIPAKSTIETIIGEKMSKGLSPDKKQARIVAMLRAAGFQMYNQQTGDPEGTATDYIRDGLQFGSLSGGQKHLIYILRCVASGPDVLLCDELLGGLDALRQPRVLRMLNRLRSERGTSILYIATELHQLHLAADAIAYMAEGVVCEYGPRDQLLESPEHPATRAYVSDYRGLPGCQVIGGKLAQNYAALADDAALAGEWLP